METVLNLLLIRFAIVAAGVAVLGLVLFAVIVRLQRRGTWEQTRGRCGEVAVRAADLYARRSYRGDRPTWKAKALTAAAERLSGHDQGGR